MDWGFGAGELVVASDLAAALEPAAKRFTVWEVTGEEGFAVAAGLAQVRAVLPSFRFRLTYHASFRRVDLAAADPARRARDVALVQEQLGLARGLGAEAVVVHPGKGLRGVPDAGAMERCRDSLRSLAPVARELGLELRVENMPRGAEELAQDGAALASLVETTTRAACWDLGHARTFPEMAKPGPALAFVRELHLHDNGGASDDHRPLSEASTWVPGALRAMGHVGLITLELRTVAECLASRDAADALLG